MIVFPSRRAEESTPGSPGEVPPHAGEQDEFGVKTSWHDGRLTASFVYFDIAQTNQQVPNSEWYINPSLPKDLFLDTTSDGWEVEGTYTVNKNLALLGNYSAYKARQALGTRLRGVPDRTWGLYADYRCGVAAATSADSTRT